MGITLKSAKFLLGARKRGVRFDRTLTLGRQSLYLLDDDFAILRKRYQLEVDDSRSITGEKFADSFFEAFLGASEVDSMDLSGWEGATIIHDLNADIPPDLEMRYDAVVDGGTLEHIFNFPVALKNCMRMVRKNGTLFICNVANNYFGHGFYQFSPEVFFRALSPENGYRIERFVLFEHPYPSAELSTGERWYEVVDPDAVRRRVRLITKIPAAIMIEATRVGDGPIFLHPPQQSDYATAWAGESRSGNEDQSIPQPPRKERDPLGRASEISGEILSERNPWGIYRLIYSLMPHRFRRQRMLAGLYQRSLIPSLNDKRFFRPIREEDQ